MEYTGLIWKYKLNRELTDQERRDQLKQTKRLDVAPTDQLSIIKKNSAFIEIVDKFYAFRGFSLIFMLVAIGMIGTLLCAMGIFVVLHPDHANRTAQLLSVGFIFLIFTPALAFCVWAALKESFTYTHWPVRLNRENRMVYVFRHNGEGGVLEVPWDDVFFTIGVSKGQFMGSHDCYLCGHVLDDDKIVRDTFSFGAIVTESDVSTHLMALWEYIRRFMAEGTNAVPEPQFKMPIEDRREGFVWGLRRVWANFDAGFLIYWAFTPVAVASGLARYFGMQTSRIPRWPEHVKKVCGGE